MGPVLWRSDVDRCFGRPGHTSSTHPQHEWGTKKAGHDKSRWISLKQPSGSLLDQREWIRCRRPVDHFYIDDRNNQCSKTGLDSKAGATGFSFPNFSATVPGAKLTVVPNNVVFTDQLTRLRFRKRSIKKKPQIAR